MTKVSVKKRLILASSSPRRRELLSAGGYEFEVVPPYPDEPNHSVTHLLPRQQAESLAYFKARTVFDEYADSIVIGADTLVACGEIVVGKPTDEAHAREMLAMLSSKRHRVISGVAILCPAGVRRIASDVTFVTMRKMARSDIDSYIASGEWKGKSGAYAIQETADKFIEKLEGSFSNVVGLPMELLGRMIKEISTLCSEL